MGNFDFVPNTLTYNGSVTSFGGVHNLDVPLDAVCVTIQVVNWWDLSPMPNAQVTAHGGGGQYESYGTTDANGFVCLLVQKNAQFSVEASVTVGSSYYATPIQSTFTSPNFTSDASACGNSVTCPLLGTHKISLVTGGIINLPVTSEL